MHLKFCPWFQDCDKIAYRLPVKESKNYRHKMVCICMCILKTNNTFGKKSFEGRGLDLPGLDNHTM